MDDLLPKPTVVGPWDRVVSARDLLARVETTDMDETATVVRAARGLLDQAIGDRSRP